MENLHRYGVFQSCQKGISKINITATSNVLFDTSGCRKRSGCFFVGGEWRAQHVIRCGKIVSKKSPRRVAVDGKAQLLEAPSSSGSFVRGIKIGKAANRVGTLTPTNSRGFQRWSFWHQKSMVLFGGSKVQFFLFSVDIFCNFERKNTSGTWNRKRLYS